MKVALFIALIFFANSLALSEEFNVEQINFISKSEKLSGSIVFPANTKVYSAVVFVHGSGKQERSIYWAKRFAENGIAALVYDKRGVGKSEGVYESQQSVSEKNIRLLVDDSIAAISVLRGHPKTKSLPIGLAGISQAGWIAPVAAVKSKTADFLLLWSGPVCKVSEEDIYSKYTSDLDKQRVPTYSEALKARKTKYIWPDFLGKDMDPSDSLKALKIPGLWIFGERDGSVPVDLSIQNLRRLIELGHDYEYILFSKLGHNNMEETFSTGVDWIKRLAQKN